MRTPRFHAFMHRLAVFATLLLLCAPLASRWQQSATPADAQPMCTAEGLLPPDAHAGSHAPGGHDAAPDAADGGLPAHGEHGYACDYCVLAARLLPLSTLALPTLPPVHAPALAGADSLFPPSAPYWPAHAPRGPPPTA